MKTGTRIFMYAASFSFGEAYAGWVGGVDPIVVLITALLFIIAAFIWEAS